MAAGMGCTCFRIAVRMGIADKGIHLSHDHHTGAGPSGVIGTGKTCYIRPGTGLKAMVFQNLQTVFLGFCFFKSCLRVMPEPVTICLYLRQLFLKLGLQPVQRFLV